MGAKLFQRLSRGRARLRMSRVFSASLIFVATTCATPSFHSASAENWLPDGSLSLVRPVPRLSIVSEAMAQPKSDLFNEPKARMRSPSEIPAPESAPQIVIETTKHTLTLSLPGENPVTVKAQGAYALKKGTYTVALKQMDPLWYAPPTYFLRRGMKVPPEGSKARYMRGALGHQALFFDKQAAIHSGPIWNDEIGGVKLSQQDMNRLFETVTIGTQIQVK